ncbi:MAG: single-stranded DNA-binding protein [Planctomycetes bacterium]|nr:single-stranded DNA-binding protein [Planctomycetota bacterium]
MAGYNRVVLMGNLTRDPQLSYTPSNTALCKFGLASGRKWKDRDGNMQDEVCFVDCTIFGRSAETFNQYMSKGRPVLLEGRLSYQQWTTPEGTKRSKHEVIVERFTFVGGRGADEGGGGDDFGNTASAPAGAAAGSMPPPPVDDDIPF